jgi:hypothetical protein
LESPAEVDIVAALGGEGNHGSRYSVYVPSKDRSGHDIDQPTWIEEAVDLFADIGQGCTVMPAVTGIWQPERATRVVEQPVVVYVYILPELFLENLARIRRFLHRMGRLTNQGSVAAEFDGQFFTIERFDGEYNG